ncbi:lysozyme [Avibacterium paragallinarum]|uniref:lysozyme n=1 Tax=Avibacterium paragallinarum TaxID=728 RepID=UPI0006152685|nr:lysozyme [Avibacterium paragallinarum]KAA6209317.1 lysozyme [Avibacterium paragallinarum]KKB01550.1 glycoside hydrolase [Avibacterium paragallinarum]RZN72242.1 lysozyme [Avibacterium paragallinarum]
MKMSKKTNHKGLLMCAVFAVLALVGAKYSQDLRTSPQGLQLIANAEGCVRNPYQCPSDVLTVGIGTTDNVEKIKPNKIYSHDEIARLYAKGIKQAEQCVNQHANGQAMPQGAFDALVSITYNVGCGKMRKSTLFKLAKQGYKPAMCDQFPRWVYSNGKPLKGLIERRKKERDLCLDG